MLALRLALKISRQDFASLIGMSVDVLATREIGRRYCHWRSGELSRVKDDTRAHLASCHAAFLKCFQEPALAAAAYTNLNAYRLSSMRLPSLNDQQRNQVETALKQVDSISEVLPPWTTRLADLRQEAADVEAKAERLNASGKHDEKTVASLQAVGAQRAVIAEKIAAEEAAFAAQLRSAADIVRGSAALIHNLCWGPLAAQLRQRATAALIVAMAPFGVEASRSGLTDEEFLALPAVRELTAFCNTGRNFAYDTFNKRPSPTPPAAEDVLTKATALKATLKNIHEGREVFTYTSPHVAAA